jgi:hypothetical protein
VYANGSVVVQLSPKPEQFLVSFGNRPVVFREAPFHIFIRFRIRRISLLNATPKLDFFGTHGGDCFVVTMDDMQPQIINSDQSRNDARLTLCFAVRTGWRWARLPRYTSGACMCLPM